MLNNKKLVKFVALASAAAFGVTIPAITDASSTRSSEARIQHEHPARPSRDEVGKTGQNRTERQPREVRHEQERTDEREHATHREESRESFYEVNRQENIKEVNKENKVEDEYNRESANRKDTDTVIYSRDDEDDKQDINITINNNVNVDNDVDNTVDNRVDNIVDNNVNNNVENNVDNRVDNDVNNENNVSNTNENDVRNENNVSNNNDNDVRNENNNTNQNDNNVNNENNNNNTNKNTNNNDNDNSNSNTNINDNDNTNSNANINDNDNTNNNSNTNDNDINNNGNSGGNGSNGGGVTPPKKDEVVYSDKILGDVDSDGKVTQADAELLMKYINHKITCEDLDLSVADVNKDNAINIKDTVNILKYVQGKEHSPGIGERIPLKDIIIVEDDSRAGMTLYKPVIYLYPTKKTNVFVNLDFDGIFTCTYPRINDGWKVSAEPDGTLKDKNGRNYSYLFWEGDTKVPMEFNEGFCVAGKDTEAFLLDKLSYMGLNDKEINDFMVFWLPRMQDNPYNVISFQMDNYLKAAQLKVSPRPDTMIRVFMAWKKSDNFVNIKAQNLVKTQRKGFALVEWGGTEVMDGSQINLLQ